MESLSIPHDNVVPISEVAPGICGLRIVFVNVFGVSHGAGIWTLVDAGMPFSASYIRNWAAKQFGGPPEAIVLTHGHFDHVSGARELADEWQVPIYAHLQEFPYLTGLEAYPAPNVGADDGMMSWLSPLYPRGPVDLADWLRPFTESEAGDGAALPGWRILRTPGHTRGHVSFFRPSDRVLLAGDAFCTTKPESFFEAAVAQKPELHGPPGHFTWNSELAAASIERLAALQPEVVAPGHGHPLAGAEVAIRMSRFAQEIAVSKRTAA